jgi:DNA polymerase IV
MTSSSIENVDVSRTPVPAGQLVGFRRTTSAPTPGSVGSVIVKDTPPHARNHLRSLTKGVTQLANEISLIEDTPLRNTDQHTLSRPIPEKTRDLDTSTNAAALGKRKRKSSFDLLPTEHQIFQGLTFYYLPNDDIAKARKIRITKAREHGATWTRDMGPHVSHLIVDKKLTYKDALSFFKIPSLPDHIVVVNDTYPLDCIRFQELLDPAQKQYQVSGVQELKAQMQLEDPATLQASNQSLQLKPTQSRSGKWDYVPSPGTPSRSDQSMQSAENDKVHNIPQDLSADIRMVVPIGRNDINKAEPGQSSYDPEPNQASLFPKAVKDDDPLQELIEKVCELRHLPLDEDDFGIPSLELNDLGSERELSAEPSEPRLKFSTKKGRPQERGFRQENFSYMKGDTTDDILDNPNTRTIEILQEIATYYNGLNNK